MLEADLDENQMPVGKIVPDWRGTIRPPQKTLTGKYCTLEPLTLEQHGKDLFVLNLQDTTGRDYTYLPYGPFPDKSSFEIWLSEVSASPETEMYAIMNPESRSAVGHLGYLRIDPVHGSIELGHVKFSDQIKRSQLSSEAVYLMINNVFALGYRRLEWKCNALNKASRKAAQRFGFSYEGTFRQLMVVKGRNRDTAWFSILDHEWHPLKKMYTQWLDSENFNAKGEQKISLSEMTRPLLTQIDPEI